MEWNNEYYLSGLTLVCALSLATKMIKENERVYNDKVIEEVSHILKNVLGDTSKEIESINKNLDILGCQIKQLTELRRNLT